MQQTFAMLFYLQCLRNMYTFHGVQHELYSTNVHVLRAIAS